MLNKEIPIFGLRDVLTAMASVPYKKGLSKVTAGESYIELVKFTVCLITFLICIGFPDPILKIFPVALFVLNALNIELTTSSTKQKSQY